MGKRGPKPTPTKSLKLRGSWRAGGRTNEPQPEGGIPAAPKWMTREGKTAWRYVAPLLERMGILTKCDRNALIRYCETWARWREAAAFVAQHGEVYSLKDEHGKPKCFVQFPQATLYNKLSLHLLRLEQEFGLTPSARAGMAVVGKPKETSGKARFFGAG